MKHELKNSKARAALDKILKPTKFDSRTKALWAYYRSNKSVSKIHNARDLCIYNLKASGDLRLRLMSHRCKYCPEQDCEKRITDQQKMDHFKKSIRPTTIARWQYAKTLIDIAKAKA